MTAKAKTSEIIKINERAGEGFYTVSSDTFFVIKKSLCYSEMSKGKFDITVGSLVRLWGIGTDEARVPTTSEISETLPLVDYKQVELSEDKHGVFLKKHGRPQIWGMRRDMQLTSSQDIKTNGVESGVADLGVIFLL